MAKEIKNALSVDLEDWFQGILQVDSKDWSKYENRLAINLSKILAILSNQSIKATFFVLGYIAEKYSTLVTEIVQAGHEIACHGYYHEPIYKQTPEEFREDVLRSKKTIESIINTNVIGYRAPFFSMAKDCMWAIEILQELGFKYDSSVFPTKNFLYGIPDAPQRIYKLGKTDIVEFPLSVLNVMGFKLPICGGFYLRSLPYFVTRYGIQLFNKKGWPVIIYIHPWELDVEKPKLPMGLKWRIIHEYNLNTMEKKFTRLVQDFNFTTVEEVLFGE